MSLAKENSISKRLRGFSAWAAVALVLLGTIVGFATFLLLTGVTPIKPTPENTAKMLYANGVIVVLMLIMIASQMAHLLWERKQGMPGAGLHIRLISLFSLVAIVPAILVAVFATVTLNRGLDSWFSDRTKAIVDTAATVADAYLSNASEATRNDLANIASDLVLQEQLQDFSNDRPVFLRRVARHVALRNLAAVYIFDDTTKVINANVPVDEKITFIAPPAEAIAQAEKGDIVLIPAVRGSNLIRTLMKLPGYPGKQYLYAYRLISPQVIDQLVKTRDAKAEYDLLQKQRLGVQLTYGLVYALLATIFLLASVWAGMWFADRLVAPVVRLLDASRGVAAGDLSAKVKVIDGPGDLQVLSRTFNVMTDRLAQNRDDLIHTNEQLDDRRRFTEAMLEGVSAGVIGIDPDGRISLVNRAALMHLGLSDQDLLGRAFAEAVPEFASLYQTALSRPQGSADAQIDLKVKDQEVSFIARITTEHGDVTEHGHVLTFDDITQLVSAQRNSAWSDIARRIAHEIKNPLTPIQLSAERLKRKYLKEISSDKHVFEQCTDTIIRQVGDLGRIVDEFSSFARMPSAVLEPNNLDELVREATVLQRVSSSDIDIDLQLSDPPLIIPLDRRLITQAVTNLVKNAREAIEARGVFDGRGHILIETGIFDGAPALSITDNGVGLPVTNRNRLAEPYMTTREKGTGLGLAIVKRIMEEHGGRLKLSDAASGQGAMIMLEFAVQLQPALETA